MLCILLRSKLYCCSIGINHCLNPSITLISSIITNSTQNEISQKQIQRSHFSLSSKHHDKHPQLLGFIDNLNDEMTLQTLHGRVIKNGCIVDLDVGNYVLSLYSKFKDLGTAQKPFDEMPVRDVKTWTVLVSGFAPIGLFRGLDYFARMISSGVCPNGFTLSSVFKCCSSIRLVNGGKAIHGWMLKSGVVLDDVLKNSITDFYVKSDELDRAKKLFESTDEVDTVLCNIMIGANLRSGHVVNALDLFRRLSTKDVATWNTLLSGLMRNGYESMALERLYEMVEEKACFNEFTYTIALSLVASLSMLSIGAQIHARLIRLRFYVDEYVRSSLIDMYSQCGVVDKASLVFKQMPRGFSQKQRLMMVTVSFSAMVSGYARNGRSKEALHIDMIRDGIGADKYTLTTIVSVCAANGLLKFGEQMHGLIYKSGYKLDLVLCSSLVDMYSKCGSLRNAQIIFDQTATRNTVLWTAIINGYAFHGFGREAVRLFDMMLEDGIQPSEITFVAVLTACSHAGLIDEGRNYFKVMKGVYNIKPGVEHFTCMVDLFGRAGNLDEIKNFIHENDLSHLSSVWRVYLSSCRLHKNYDMGKWVSEKLLELEPLDAEPYLMLSNMYGTSNRWEESARVWNLMQEKGVRKQPGQSWIQHNCRTKFILL